MILFVYNGIGVMKMRKPFKLIVIFSNAWAQTSAFRNSESQRSFYYLF